MTVTPKKAILFAPDWRREGCVGNYRTDRFARWLAEDGYDVVVVCAGLSYGERQHAWGLEIVVRDPLGFHRNTSPGAIDYAPPRKPNRLRRAVVEWVFNPGPPIVWARAAAKFPAVVKATLGAELILSSSPPESAHVGAWMLSRRTGVPLIVDMRDGWLDEPLKRLLRTSALRRWREGRMESRILGEAKAIQVTSDVWKKLLCDRYPAFASKVHVLTNGYPHHTATPQPQPPKLSNGEFVLIHAGRFIQSRSTQCPDLLLEPLLHNLSSMPSSGTIRLIGPLSIDELTIIEPFKPRFATIGWSIECPGSLPRSELMAQLAKADGLLLLSASHAALPSKLFEYIPTGRPLFVVTYEGSATWSVCVSLPQATLIDATLKTTHPNVANQGPFYTKSTFQVPPEFCEQSLAQSFKKLVNSLAENANYD